MSEETAPPPPIKIAWLLGLLVAFALFAAIGGYSARMTQTYTDYDQDQAAIRTANLAQVQADEGKLLCPLDDNKKPTAEWVDQDKGIIRLPIDEAMTKAVDTLKTQELAAGCEIPGAVPAPPPATTNAAPAQLPSAGATNAAPVKPAAPAAKPKPDAKPDAKPKTPAKPKT